MVRGWVQYVKKVLLGMLRLHPLAICGGGAATRRRRSGRRRRLGEGWGVGDGDSGEGDSKEDKVRVEGSQVDVGL